MKSLHTFTITIVFAIITAPALYADNWHMKQKDQFHTGRANVTIPLQRQGSSFFDAFLWQTPTPGSPNDGRIGAGSMSFFDTAGPDGSDIVVAGYHWPKGIQGMDRHTGEVFWAGNPDGGETIGEITPAFSFDGSTVYVVNDYTSSGAALMGFYTSDSPANFWGNQLDTNPANFQYGSPVYCPSSGTIYAHGWYDKPYGAIDIGVDIYQVWQGARPLGMIYSEPSVWEDPFFGTIVIAAGRDGDLSATDEFGTEIWAVSMPDSTDATPSIDPLNGNSYIACGWNDIFVVAVDIFGDPIWEYEAIMVSDTEDGTYSPQHAIDCGCLSHDGATYYFQTVAQDGSGKLYAINTIDGSTKWAFDTQSKGWENYYSCPIITLDNIIVIGNNENGTYFAIRDDGQNTPTLLDTFDVSANSEGYFARASATISSDQTMYLPLCTTWSTSNGSGDTPDFSVQNMFAAFDLSENAQPTLPAPANQRAFAGNSQITLKWNPIDDNSGIFDHYAVFRSEAPFDTVEALTPIAQLSDINQNSWTDTTAINETAYYYAISSISAALTGETNISSIGPRIPFDETDLQVVSISRTPFYPRYCTNYTSTLVTESDTGYGPYWLSACTSLCSDQDENTKHLPEPGESVIYTATCRNRGSNTINSTVTATWTLDTVSVDSQSINITLNPGETFQQTFQLNWDSLSHDLQFAIDIIDSRPENNSLNIDTNAVGFLTYIDQSFIENFRDIWSPDHTGSTTNDIIDWLNLNMARFNELLAMAGTAKRVRYDILQVLDDLEPDPTSPAAINFASFPFRYHWATDSDPRTSGYYHNDDDIDYGLLHEMGHQLGMIDIYQLNLDSSANLVNSQSYSAHPDLMNGCSPFLNTFHALAMDSWLNVAHGMYGQYLYNIPQQIQLHLIGRDGNHIANASVKMYQMCETQSQGKVITDQVKAQGTTDTNGLFTLPNSYVDPALVPPSPTGEVLHDNPFGYVHVVGTNGLLLFEVEYNDEIDFCWLDITETNVAYWQGNTTNAVFQRELSIGGPKLHIMPRDLAENNYIDWTAWAQDATSSVSLDTENYITGNSSIKFTTDGGADTYIRYPETYNANWDLTTASELNIWFHPENDTPYGFQNNSPWIRLYDDQGSYFQYRWYQYGSEADFLNQTNYQWALATIELNPEFTDDGWNRSEFGSPNMAAIKYIEIHADTWDSGFKLWVDGIYFNWEDFKYCDISTDDTINIDDLAIFAQFWLTDDTSFHQSLGSDQNSDNNVNLLDLTPFATNWLN